MKIYLDNGSEPVLTLTRMKNLEEQLPSPLFVRIHRSYIVNVKKIDAIDRNRVILGQYRLPIGESYDKGLYSALSGTSLLPE